MDEPIKLDALIEIVRGQAFIAPMSDAQEDFNRGVESAAKILEDMLPREVVEAKIDGVEDPLGEWALDMEGALEEAENALLRHDDERSQAALARIRDVLSFKPEEAKQHSDSDSPDALALLRDFVAAFGPAEWHTPEAGAEVMHAICAKLYNQAKALLETPPERGGGFDEQRQNLVDELARAEEALGEIKGLALNITAGHRLPPPEHQMAERIVELAAKAPPTRFSVGAGDAER